MSTQYCKVGKKSARLNNTLSFKVIENKAKQYVKSTSNQKSTKDFDVAT